MSGPKDKLLEAKGARLDRTQEWPVLTFYRKLLGPALPTGATVSVQE